MFGEGGLGQEDTMISAAQLLDELMGRDRNLAPDEKRSNVRWDHESVSEVKPPLPSLLPIPLAGFCRSDRDAGCGAAASSSPGTARDKVPALGDVPRALARRGPGHWCGAQGCGAGAWRPRGALGLGRCAGTSLSLKARRSDWVSGREERPAIAGLCERVCAVVWAAGRREALCLCSASSARSADKRE